MRKPLLTALLTLLILLALIGCAKGWQGSCPELSKNAEEIRKLEDRIARLQADGPTVDPAHQAKVASLEERRRDLQLDNIQLMDNCGPSVRSGSQTDYDKRRLERIPEPR